MRKCTKNNNDEIKKKYVGDDVGKKNEVIQVRSENKRKKIMIRMEENKNQEYNES